MEDSSGRILTRKDPVVKCAYIIHCVCVSVCIWIHNIIESVDSIHQGAELAIAHAIIKCYFCY